jgi:hypothetical protein
MVSNTTQHPPPPPSHKLSVYTILLLWEGGEVGEMNQIELRGVIAHKAGSKKPS